MIIRDSIRGYQINSMSENTSYCIDSILYIEITNPVPVYINRVWNFLIWYSEKYTNGELYKEFMQILNFVTPLKSRNQDNNLKSRLRRKTKKVSKNTHPNFIIFQRYISQRPQYKDLNLKSLLNSVDEIEKNVHFAVFLDEKEFEVIIDFDDIGMLKWVIEQEIVTIKKIKSIRFNKNVLPILEL